MALDWKSGRLQAGKLRHRIDIVNPTNVQDSTGGTDLSDDVVIENVWASVEAVSGSESFAAGSQVSIVSHQIVIRYPDTPPRITSAMQVWFNGRQFQIVSVMNPDERNKMLCLMVIEINDSRQQNPNIPGDLN